MALRKRRQNSINQHINVTPFVDVVLVLLIIFMIFAPMMNSNINVALPESSTKVSSNSVSTIDVEIAKNGRLSVDGNLMGLKAFNKYLADLKELKNPSEVNIFIFGDKAANYQSVITVIDVIAENGYTNINLATKQK